jgi:hypothetical protein
MKNDIVSLLRADAEATDDIGLCADAANEIESLTEIVKASIYEIKKQEIETETLRDVVAKQKARIEELLWVETRILALESNLLHDARRAVEAWDCTVLHKPSDGMMQERMEYLRAAVEKL